MNIGDALRESRKTGRAFERGDSGPGWDGWIKYDAEHTYRLSAEDLMSDDWEPLGGDNNVR